MLKDFIRVNKYALDESKKRLKFFPLLGLALFCYSLINLAALLIIAKYFNNIRGLGFLTYLLKVAETAHFLGLMQNVIIYQRLSLNDLLSMGPFFNNTINFIFVFYVINYLIGILSFNQITPAFFGEILNIALLAFISPGFDMIYIDGYEGYSIFTRLPEFFKENFINWIPAILIMLLYNYLGNISIFMSIMDIIVSLMLNFLLSILLIYKGNLYVALAHSSRRKREFEAKFN